MPGVQRSGVILCLVSAAAFGAIGIFGKLAYDEGVDRRHAAVRPVHGRRRPVLGARAATGALRGAAPARRAATSVAALALGAVGYGAQAGAYFAALERLDASLLSLLLYTYPAMVTVAAIALGRERASRRTTVALALACSGLVLVLAGAAAGRARPARHRARRSAPRSSTRAYILVSTGIAERVGPLALSTLVAPAPRCTPDAGRARRPATCDPGARQRHRARLAGGLAVVSTVGADRPVLRRPAPGRARPRRRSSRRSSRSSPSRSRSRCSASRSARRSSPAPRSCCSLCS